MKLKHGPLLVAALLAVVPLMTAEAKTTPKQPVPVAAPAEPPKTEPAKAEPAKPETTKTETAVPEKATKKLKVGDLEITSIEIAQGGDKIDLFASIRNNSGADETLTGAENRLEGGKVTMIQRAKDGTYAEGPVSITIPSGKRVDLSPDEQWIRITGVKGTKAHAELPLSLYFRRSPNADLMITAQSLTSSPRTLDVKIGGPIPEKKIQPPAAGPSEPPPVFATPQSAGSPAQPAQGKGVFQGLIDWFKK